MHENGRINDSLIETGPSINGNGFPSFINKKIENLSESINYNLQAKGIENIIFAKDITEITEISQNNPNMNIVFRPEIIGHGVVSVISSQNGRCFLIDNGAIEEQQKHDIIKTIQNINPNIILDHIILQENENQIKKRGRCTNYCLKIMADIYEKSIDRYSISQIMDYFRQEKINLHEIDIFSTLIDKNGQNIYPKFLLEDKSIKRRLSVTEFPLYYHIRNANPDKNYCGREIITRQRI